MAYMARVPLSATGFYATPKIHYDRKTLTGRPFFYFAYGAAVSEVAIDTLTGEHRLLAVDILHDVGSVAQSRHRPRADRRRLHPGLGLARDGGALVERERRAEDARAVHVQDPDRARRAGALRRRRSSAEPNREDTIHRSKAVGEPPFMLALSAFHALRDARRERRRLPARAAARRARDRRAHPGRRRRPARPRGPRMADWVPELAARLAARRPRRARDGRARVAARRRARPAPR